MDPEIIKHKIIEIRGQKIMLDSDLADLYQTTTKRLKEAVRRNISRFPEDFMFELSKEEFIFLRTQNASSKRGGTRYMPFAFTEQGVAMLSSVLSSEKAIEINISIIRTFITLRQFTLNYNDLKSRIENIETQFPDIYKALNYLVSKDNDPDTKTERIKIGYK